MYILFCMLCDFIVVLKMLVEVKALPGLLHCCTYSTLNMSIVLRDIKLTYRIDVKSGNSASKDALLNDCREVLVQQRSQNASKKEEKGLQESETNKTTDRLEQI